MPPNDTNASSHSLLQRLPAAWGAVPVDAWRLVWGNLPCSDRANFRLSCKGACDLCNLLIERVNISSTASSSSPAAGHNAAATFVARLPNLCALTLALEPSPGLMLQPALLAALQHCLPAYKRLKQLRILERCEAPRCSGISPHAPAPAPAPCPWTTSVSAWQQVGPLLHALPLLRSLELQIQELPAGGMLGAVLAQHCPLLEHLSLKLLAPAADPATGAAVCNSSNPSASAAQPIFLGLSQLRGLTSLELHLDQGSRVDYSPPLLCLLAPSVVRIDGPQHEKERELLLPSLRRLVWRMGDPRVCASAPAATLHRLSTLTSREECRPIDTNTEALTRGLQCFASRLRDLRELQLPGMVLDEALWSGLLSRMPNLTSVTFSSCVLDADEPPSPALTHLTHLALMDPASDPRVVRHAVEALPRLTSLACTVRVDLRAYMQPHNIVREWRELAELEAVLRRAGAVVGSVAAADSACAVGLCVGLSKNPLEAGEAEQLLRLLGGGPFEAVGRCRTTLELCSPEFAPGSGFLDALPALLPLFSNAQQLEVVDVDGCKSRGSCSWYTSLDAMGGAEALCPPARRRLVLHGPLPAAALHEAAARLSAAGRRGVVLEGVWPAVGGCCDAGVGPGAGAGCGRHEAADGGSQRPGVQVLLRRQGADGGDAVGSAIA